MRKTAILFTAILAPLALASCGGEAELPKGEPIAKVAPPAGKQWTEVVTKTEGGYQMGNPEAKLHLVEYGAISCPVCGQFAVQSGPELAAMVDSGKVRFEFRPFLVHGIQDVPGFLLSQCNGPESFFGISDALFATQETWLSKLQTLTPEEQQSIPQMKPADAVAALAAKFELVEQVKQLGVSEDNAKKCLADKAAFDTLSKSTEKTMKDGKVTGTPTFFINGAKVDGITAWQQLKGKLQEAGAR
jgi:protein-disulfide isomerase